ncbi:hypothetical protein ACB092_08G013900 [Castanea dentata]
MEKAVDAEGRFNTASSGMAPQGIGTAGATRGFVALESRMSILKKIAEALSNPSINMIGVYGPDGVGKTTLVKEVVRLAKEDNLFDAVVMVTVKQNPDTKTMIQREIAGMLGLKFDNKENVTIREDLRNRIMKEKKIIVILDDFCESLDLEDLGVPSGDSHKGCKILLTSKSPDVLCNQMDGKTNFLLEVSPLPETEALESKMLFSKKIVEALEDRNINMIGLYGGDDVGKTTLVKEVVRQAEEDNLFDAVVMVTVKQKQDLRRIQEEIADKLGLKLDSSEPANKKADFLLNRVKKEKKILIILDDFCESLDVEDLGLPSQGTHKGCKILLTSKSPDVLFNQMHSKTNFLLQVSPLREMEALELLKKTAEIGDPIEDSDLQSTAVEIARVCLGLPIALVVVGRALKKRSSVEWKKASEQLRKSVPRDTTKLQTAAHSTIKFSYIQLQSPEIQQLFLICGLMDSSIAYQDLLKRGMGLGIFQVTNTIQEARSKEYSFISKLKDSSLLLDSESGEHVIMHNVVRYASTLIASEDHNVLNMDQDIALTKWLNKDTLNICTAISLPSRHTRELPEWLGHPQRRLSYMSIKNQSEKMPDTFFDEMRGLKVFSVSEMHFSSLPASLHLLTNLRTLLMEQCVLGDLTMIGELKNLEILSLLNSKVKELPREIQQLTRLQLLDLNDCHELQVIPAGVLSSLLQLEELYMNSFKQWNVEGINGETSNVCLAELNHLSHLTTLHVHIPNTKVLPDDLLFARLNNYKICIGDAWSWLDEHESSRTLKLKLDIQLKNVVKILLKEVEALYIDELKGIKTDVCELDRDGFPLLKHLHVQNNVEILYIIDVVQLVSSVAFPILVSLYLDNLINLEEICYGQLPAGSFRNMRVLNVHCCNKLKFVFRPFVARGLLQLQEMVISKCSIMGAIVVERSEDYTEDNDGMKDIIELQQLCSLTLKDLPKLRSFYSQGKTRPSTSSSAMPTNIEPLFNQKVSFPNLQTLELNSINDVEKIWHDQLLPRASSCFQNLRKMVLYDCGNLKYLLSSSMARSLLQLQVLYVKGCLSVEEVLLTEELDSKERRMEKMFPKLEYISLESLPKLVRFSSGNLVELPALNSLQIDYCHELKTFVYDMRVDKEPGQMNSTAGRPLFNEKVSFLGFQYLSSLQVNKCYNLRSLFSLSVARGLRHLQMLRITSCKMMDEIVVVGNLEEVATKERMAEETTAEGATKEGKAMLEIAAVGESAEAASKEKKTKKEIEITFPQLKTLDFEDLPNLKWFCFSTCAFGCPSLQEVRVENCPQMSQFSGGELKTPMLKYMQAGDYVRLGARDLNSAIKDLYKLKGPLSVVEHMRLKGPDKLRKILNNKFHDQSFSELISLHALSCDEQLNVFLSNLHPLSQKLQELKIDKCHSLRHLVATSAIRDTRDDTYDVCVTKVSFVKMQKLHLISLDKFEGISHAGLLAAESFSELRELKVDNCCSLVHFMQFKSLPELKSLEKLSIQRCDSLEEVFHLEDSQIEGLHRVSSKFTQLSKLVLSNLPKLKHIFNRDFANILNSQNSHVVNVKDSGLLSNHFSTSTNKSLKQITQEKNMEALHEKQKDGKTIAKIFFPHLNSIVFENLTSLQTFSSGDISFNFPSLVTLKMRNCPKINTFSIGISRINELQDIKSPLFTEKWSSKPFKELHLEHLDQFEKIWHDKLPVRELRILIVDTCNKLSHI